MVCPTGEFRSNAENPITRHPKIGTSLFNAYRKAVKAKMEQHSIPKDGVIVFDETNDFFVRDPKRVQSSNKERKTKQTGKRCRRFTQGRTSFTVGLFFSPKHKGKVMMMASHCSTKMASDIRQCFGKYIQLFTRKGKTIVGSTHCDCVLEKCIGPFSNEVRKSSGFALDQSLLYTEDPATVHTGDSCKATSESGLKEKRTKIFRKYHLIRELMPENSTPELCEVDQLIKFVKQDKQAILDEILGQGTDMGRRPSRSENCDVFMATGGPFNTEAGNRRRPTLFQNAGAWAIAWARLSQLTCMATYIRCGWFTHAEAAEIMGESPEAILAGCTDLTRRQRALHKRGAWLHKDQDFSGSRSVPTEPVPEPSATQSSACTLFIFPTLGGSTFCNSACRPPCLIHANRLVILVRHVHTSCMVLFVFIIHITRLVI